MLRASLSCSSTPGFGTFDRRMSTATIKSHLSFDRYGTVFLYSDDFTPFIVERREFIKKLRKAREEMIVSAADMVACDRQNLKGFEDAVSTFIGTILHPGVLNQGEAVIGDLVKGGEIDEALFSRLMSVIADKRLEWIFDKFENGGEGGDPEGVRLQPGSLGCVCLGGNVALYPITCFRGVTGCVKCLLKFYGRRACEVNLGNARVVRYLDDRYKEGLKRDLTIIVTEAMKGLCGCREKNCTSCDRMGLLSMIVQFINLGYRFPEADGIDRRLSDLENGSVDSLLCQWNVPLYGLLSYMKEYEGHIRMKVIIELFDGRIGRGGYDSLRDCLFRKLEEYIVHSVNVPLDFFEEYLVVDEWADRHRDVLGDRRYMELTGVVQEMILKRKYLNNWLNVDSVPLGCLSCGGRGELEGLIGVLRMVFDVNVGFGVDVLEVFTARMKHFLVAIERVSGDSVRFFCWVELRNMVVSCYVHSIDRFWRFWFAAGNDMFTGRAFKEMFLMQWLKLEMVCRVFEGYEFIPRDEIESFYSINWKVFIGRCAAFFSDAKAYVGIHCNRNVNGLRPFHMSTAQCEGYFKTCEAIKDFFIGTLYMRKYTSEESLSMMLRSWKRLAINDVLGGNICCLELDSDSNLAMVLNVVGVIERVKLEEVKFGYAVGKRVARCREKISLVLDTKFRLDDEPVKALLKEWWKTHSKLAIPRRVSLIPHNLLKVMEPKRKRMLNELNDYNKKPKPKG